MHALQQVREAGFSKVRAGGARCVGAALSATRPSTRPTLQRREALGLAPGTTDPFFDTLGAGGSADEGDWQPPAEPPELLAARERLAALRSRDDEGTAGAGEAGADVATVLADAAGAPVVENIDPNAARGADAALFVCADSAADLDALD